MLQRKLLIMLAIITLLMLGTAISSVLLMQSALKDIESINKAAMINTSSTSTLSQTIAQIESELNILRRSPARPSDLLSNSTHSLNDQIKAIATLYTQDPEGTMPYLRLAQVMAILDHQVDHVATSTPSEIIGRIDPALLAASRMRQEITQHIQYSIDAMNTQHERAAKRFRTLVITLSGIFILLINISIFILIRTASFILKPIDSLIQASRHLANENYDHRVEVGRNDEFGELAQSFNTLAQQLQTNEERKIETLRQVARTLNHELNNAIAIIELQLRMVSNSSGNELKNSRQLQLIYDTLQQMNQTVTSLTQVRQVVLTDYIKGVKMLDLQRSTQPKQSGKIDLDPKPATSHKRTTSP